MRPTELPLEGRPPTNGRRNDLEFQRRRDPMDYQAWLIDLDGTLFHIRPIQCIMALELLFGGRRHWKIIREFRRQLDVVRSLEPDSKSSPYDLQVTLTAQQLGIKTAEVLDVVQEWMIRRPSRWLSIFSRRKMGKAIRAFRAQGGRTALVSDYPAEVKLRALGLADCFDVVVANGETTALKKLKPSPDGYLLAAESLGLPTNGCLVVGDRDEMDGAAAERAGIEYCHVASFTVGNLLTVKLG